MDEIERKEGDIWIWSTTAYEGFNEVKESHIDDLERKPKQTLYHYTSTDGLKGILSNKSFWMTDVRYMNDAKELSYAEDIIANEIDKEIKYSESQRTKHLLNYIKERFNPFGEEFRVYATCFCEADNKAGLWQRYGKYALALNTKNEIRVERKFSEPFDRWNKATFRKVVYDRQEQIKIVSNIIRDTIDAFKYNIDYDEVDEDKLLENTANLFSNLVSECLVSFKSPVFEEEEEWRMIYLGYRDDTHINKEIKTRSSGNYLIPYISMELVGTEEGDYESRMSPYYESDNTLTDEQHDHIISNIGKFPVKAVNLGPIYHEDIAIKSVKQELRNNSIGHISVESKEVSLRS